MTNRYLRVSALWGLLLVVCLGATSRVLAQSGGYRIAGKVVNSITGAPVSQALPTIADVKNRSDTKSLVTGDDGAFAFRSLPAGKYSLMAARRGFITSGYDAHEHFSTAIVTGGDAESEHLTFRLTPQAVISGKIYDEVGDPVRRAHVALYRQDQSTGVGLTRSISAAQTDDRGSYEFTELPAGTYFLCVNARPWYALHPRSQVTGVGMQAIHNSDGSVTTVPGSETVTIMEVPTSSTSPIPPPSIPMRPTRTKPYQSLYLAANSSRSTCISSLCPL
jgi:hypothetical protein